MKRLLIMLLLSYLLVEVASAGNNCDTTINTACNSVQEIAGATRCKNGNVWSCNCVQTETYCLVPGIPYCAGWCGPWYNRKCCGGWVTPCAVYDTRCKTYDWVESRNCQLNVNDGGAIGDSCKEYSAGAYATCCQHNLLVSPGGVSEVIPGCTASDGSNFYGDCTGSSFECWAFTDAKPKKVQGCFNGEEIRASIVYNNDPTFSIKWPLWDSNIDPLNCQAKIVSQARVGIDTDGDGFDDGCDNCPFHYNANQADICTPACDTVPPETTASINGTLGSDNWYNSDVSITLIATDAESICIDELKGVNYTNYYFVSDEMTELTYTEPIVISTEGESTLCYYSVDKAGNRETLTNCVDIKIDKTAPVTALNLSGEYNEPILVTLSANDDLSGVYENFYSVNYNGDYDFDNVVNMPYDAPFVLGTTGSYLITFYSIDNAGNKEVDNYRIISVFIDPDNDGVESEIDDCPLIAGSPLFLGCSSKIIVNVENHTIIQGGKNAGSTKIPLAAIVALYSKACADSNGLNKREYAAIMDNCDPLLFKGTDENGIVEFGVMPSEYMIIAKYAVFNSVTDEFVEFSNSHLTTPTDFITEGSTTQKYLQLITKINPRNNTSVIMVGVTGVAILLSLGFYRFYKKK